MSSIHIQDLVQKVNQDRKHWLINAENSFQVMHVVYLVGCLANICAAEQGRVQLLRSAKISELVGNVCLLIGAKFKQLTVLKDLKLSFPSRISLKSLSFPKKGISKSARALHCSNISFPANL